MANTEVETLSPLYAVIDLGSNSFHMLITRQLANSVQVVDKVKRKVRLAAGLDENNILSDESIVKGLECLSFFAERLQDIPPKNVRIVATATLRLAQNRKHFITQAEKILTQKISLLSGIEEARNIYLGVSYTSYSADERLVLDIGGASTEVIAGLGFDIKKATSLNIGCVTFNQKYFPNGQLNITNFDHAIIAAENVIAPIRQVYCDIGWQCVLGGSGTMQALVEILRYQQKPSVLSLQFLIEIKNALLKFNNISDINIAGLSIERSPVIASGLTILIALFKQFSIQELILSSGALREGLLYEMLPNIDHTDNRQRVVSALSQKFHIDKIHANNVKNQTRKLFDQLNTSWDLPRDNAFNILLASCDLHEIGLLLEYKCHQHHGAYILSHTDLTGFNHFERELLVLFVKLHKGAIKESCLTAQQLINASHLKKLLTCLRLAVLLCQQRLSRVMPEYQINVSGNILCLSLPKSWLLTHPLIINELQQENCYLESLGFSLVIDSLR